MQHKGGNVDSAGAAAVRQPWHVPKEQREGKEHGVQWHALLDYLLHFK